MLAADFEEEEVDEEFMSSTVSLPRPLPTQGEGTAFAPLELIVPITTAAQSSQRLSPASKPLIVKGGVVEANLRSKTSEENSGEAIRGRYVGLLIDSTWEDREFCGLTGIEVVLADGKIAVVNKSDIQGEPHGLAVLGYEGDIRTPDKLVDGVNNTTNEDHMWLFPFTPGSRHELRIDLRSTETIKGLRIWNYNKSSDAARSRGAKCATIIVDDKPYYRCLLRIVSVHSGAFSRLNHFRHRVSVV